MQNGTKIKAILVVITLTVILYYHVLDNNFAIGGRTNEVHYGSHPKSQSNDASPHHMLLLDESVHERIKNTNSSQYTWYGNQWVPPPGIPIFTPRQLKAYYSKRNILVIGDSTSRRFHNTLVNMINAADLDDLKLKEIDRDDFQRRNSCSAEIGDARYITKMTPGMRPFFKICRNNTIEVKDSNKEAGNATAYFSLDQIYLTCYGAISRLWRDNEEETSALNEDLAGFKEDYDLIIVAAGIWELAAKGVCDKDEPGTTTQNRTQILLDNLEKNNPDGLQVVFRTSAWDKRFPIDDDLRNSNALSYQYFHDLDQKSALGRYQKNLTLVDWGGVMYSRSYNEDRIEGNHPAHYGIEGRLLFIQQLTHELVKSELIAWDVKNGKRGSAIRSSKSPSVRE